MNTKLHREKLSPVPTFSGPFFTLKSDEDKPSILGHTGFEHDDEPSVSSASFRENTHKAYSAVRATLFRGSFEHVIDEPVRNKTYTPEAFSTTILRRPDYHNPFEPFLTDDLTHAAYLLQHGFDPFFRDERGLTCAMAAASLGHSAVLNLVLKHVENPQALALVRCNADIDAFDIAAAIGSVACMSVLSRMLPPDYKSSIGRGFLWHAVDASAKSPELSDAWLADLCSNPATPLDQDAIDEARDLGWSNGLDRLLKHSNTLL